MQYKHAPKPTSSAWSSWALPPKLARLGALALVAAALAVPASAASAPVTINVVGYSVVKQAFAKLISAYQKTPQGQGVQFTQAYGASGTEASDVIAGQPADVVNLALEPDMAKLVEAGKVAADWSAGRSHGMVTDSVVVFIVRKGNPKHIKTWADLTKPGVSVLTPNPLTSGGARWNILAAYGAQLELGRTKAQARAYLLKLFQHVPSQDASEADALADFNSGTGDVLLDYEDDAIQAERAGDAISYVVPPQTILIQNPLGVTTTSQDAPAAKAFASFLISAAGQKIWGKEGFRPVDAKVAKQFHFPKPSRLFKIGFLGGWQKVVNKFFDPETGLVTKIEQQVGGASPSG